MQSRTSYFNFGLYQKIIRRFWPLWAAMSLLGCLVPVSMLLRSGRMSLSETTGLYYDVIWIVAPIVGILYALPCALAVWSYLHQSRSVGMMHSLPLRRESLFITSAASGMTMLLLPYVFAGLLTVLVTAMRGEISGLVILQTVGACAGEGLLFFSLATLAAMVSGSSFVAAALYIIWNFLAPFAELICNAFAGGFLPGVGSDFTGKLNFLSPVIYLIEHVEQSIRYDEVGEVTAVSLKNYGLVGIYALAGLALLVISCLLYRQRRSETAGDAISVGALRPVFLWVTAALAALVGGVVFYAILFSGLFGNLFGYGDIECYRVIPMVLCMALGAAIGYFGAQMMLKKTTRVFGRKNLAGYLALVLACILLCLGMKADIFGIAGRVPQAEQVESVTVSVDAMDAEIRAEDTELLAAVLQAHRSVVGQLDSIAPYDDDMGYTWFTLNYTLSDGSELCRSYCIPQSYETGSEAWAEAIQAITSGPDFLLRALHAEETGYKVWNIDYYNPGSIDYYNPDSDGSRSFTEEESELIFEALVRDIRAGRADAVISGRCRENDMGELPYLDICYRYTANDNRWETAYVTNSMKDTVAVLQSLGCAIGE